MPSFLGALLAIHVLPAVYAAVINLNTTSTDVPGDNTSTSSLPPPETDVPSSTSVPLKEFATRDDGGSHGLSGGAIAGIIIAAIALLALLLFLILPPRTPTALTPTKSMGFYPDPAPPPPQFLPQYTGPPIPPQEGYPQGYPPPGVVYPDAAYPAPGRGSYYSPRVGSPPRRGVQWGDVSVRHVRDAGR
ncbi:hypothetical protein IAT38_005168 [Cryptococcus sp. DSM 104549]